jgi:hypothetical protein
MNICECSPSFHKVTTLTAGTNSVEMTITNPNNISSLDDFELVLCTNPNNVVTGDPLPYTVTINGTAGVALRNKYNLPIYTNRLKTRKRYYGSYVNDGTTSWVILWNTPTCARYATQQ